MYGSLWCVRETSARLLPRNTVALPFGLGHVGLALAFARRANVIGGGKLNTEMFRARKLARHDASPEAGRSRERIPQP